MFKSITFIIRLNKNYDSVRKTISNVVQTTSIKPRTVALALLKIIVTCVFSGFFYFCRYYVISITICFKNQKDCIWYISVLFRKALIQMAVKRVYILLKRIPEAGHCSTSKIFCLLVMYNHALKIFVLTYIVGILWNFRVWSPLTSA